MPKGKKWQAVMDYGPPAGHGETVATADSLRELLVNVEEARTPDLIMKMMNDDQISIDLFYGELPQ